MSIYDQIAQQVAPQKSEAWHDIRLGRFTSSELYKLMTEPRLKADKDAGNLSEGALTYVMTKIAEKLTGQRKELDTYAVDWGNKFEPLAIELYEKLHGVKVIPTGFIPADPNAGGSPDGLVGEDIVIEIKCPYASENHIANLYDLHKETDLYNCHRDYYWQIQGNLLWTKRSTAHFISYDPRLLQHYPKLALKVLEVKADEVAHERIMGAVLKANEKMLEIMELIANTQNLGDVPHAKAA